MGLTLQIGWLEVGLAVSMLLLYLYYSWTSAYTYWKRHNVPFLTPKFPFGNARDVLLLQKNFLEFWVNIYNEMGDRPVCGIYSGKQPMLVVKDRELIKKIVIKDFNHFTDHGWYGYATGPKHEPLLHNNLFHMEGEVWKQMRSKLSPAFTSGKMKMMFPITYGCSQQFIIALDNICKGTGTFEVKDLMSRFAVDVIVNSVFGLNSMSVHDPDCHFYKSGMNMFERSFKRRFASVILFQLPKIYNLFKLHFIGYDSAEYFANIVKQSIEDRESKQTANNDFVDILVRLKNNQSIEDEDMLSSSHTVTDRRPRKDDTASEKRAAEDYLGDLLAQALLFFLAGFETTAATLSFTLYELSRRPHLQLKVQEEVDAALECHGGFTYQMLKDLPYIDKVLDETLRLYGALATMDRMCVKDYNLPGTDIVIEKGCKVVIPTYAIHHDPQYFPDPENFDPDRFQEENVKSRPSFTYMPFGEGPRLCIGMRFGRMEMRLALSMFFSKFGCKLHPSTPVPLGLAYGEILVTTNDNIMLDLIRRNTN